MQNVKCRHDPAQRLSYAVFSAYQFSKYNNNIQRSMTFCRPLEILNSKHLNLLEYPQDTPGHQPHIDHHFPIEVSLIPVTYRTLSHTLSGTLGGSLWPFNC